MTAKPRIPVNKIKQHVAKIEAELLQQNIDWAIQRDNKLNAAETAAAAILKPGQECWWSNPCWLTPSWTEVIVSKMKGRRVHLIYKDHRPGHYGVTSNGVSMKHIHPEIPR